MTLVNILVVFVVIGLALYLINTYIPMAPPIKNIMNIVVILIVLLWVLELFGILHTPTIPLR